jgi:hypothetical protein
MRKYFIASGLAFLLFAAVPAARDAWQSSGRSAAAGRLEDPAANPFLAGGATDPGGPFLRGPTFGGHSPETNLADAGPPVLGSRALGQSRDSRRLAGGVFIAVGILGILLGERDHPALALPCALTAGRAAAYQ